MGLVKTDVDTGYLKGAYVVYVCLGLCSSVCVAELGAIAFLSALPLLLKASTRRALVD